MNSIFKKMLWLTMLLPITVMAQTAYETDEVDFYSVVTLKLNNKYWPSYEISQEENIWKRNAFL